MSPKSSPFYKNGDRSKCDNYRPISLVSVLYKLYATVLINRMKVGGPESRLWKRQFGFRSGRSTKDALFIARRRIEQALAPRGGFSLLLALDWRKAFDSIAAMVMTVLMTDASAALGGEAARAFAKGDLEYVLCTDGMLLISTRCEYL